MPNHLELAQLSKQIYFKKGGFVPGWNCLNHYEDDQGLAIGVYQNNKNEVVIAFRGTDTGNVGNFLSNILTNIQLFLGSKPNLIEDACNFVQNTREERSVFSRLTDWFSTGNSNQLYLTGHSLGGMIAHLVGFKMLYKQKNYRVVSFENPGIGHFVAADEIRTYRNKIEANFLTWLANPNLINTSSPHIGLIRHIRISPHGSSFFARGGALAARLTDCLMNDIFRIILLSFLLSYLLNDDYYLKIILSVAEYLSTCLAAQKYLPEIDFSGSDRGFGTFLKGLGVFVSWHAFSELISQTGRQHTLDNIINQLTAEKGLPEQAGNIASWPGKKDFIWTNVNYSLNWINPLKHKSLLTFTRLEEMEETSIQKMISYK